MRRLVVCALLVLASCAVPARAAFSGELLENPEFMVYLPEPLRPDQRYPLVAAFSPGADARSMISAWKGVADARGWIVCASKLFHNGELSVQLPVAKSMVEKVILTYPIDRARIIATGFSGGAMVSHLLARTYPYLISAVVANTGMINEEFRDAGTYPSGKLAVFVASPTDFRYTQMKKDKEFLERAGWETEWIEFSGGHRVAPPETYLSAAAWIAAAWDAPDACRK